MLSNAEDKKFKEVMEKVGMVKKPLHVRQFRNSLLEWMKDPGITLCIFYHVFRNNGVNVYLCVIQILDLTRYRIYMLFSFYPTLFHCFISSYGLQPTMYKTIGREHQLQTTFLRTT